MDETLEIDEIVNNKESMNHPLENVIGNLNQRTLRLQAQSQSNFFCFISTIEPKNVNEALGDESWIVAMQEELNQFAANDVWELVPQHKNMTIIGTKWVFRNKIPYEGAYVFSHRWSLDELLYGVPSEGPYQTNLPSPDDIISYIQEDQEGQVTRIRHQEEIDVQEYQVLTREIEPTLKPLEEIIWENIFCMGVQIRDEHRGGLRSIEKGFRNLWRNLKKKITTTPSPTTTSSSLTPPNAPSKITSTNQTSSSQENTSCSFHSKLQISPPSSHESTPHHHLNPLLDNISNVPPRPLNPQPLQSHPSLDITLSLSPITLLDHIHETSSPPSPPQPQPHIIGNPLFYNYHDYHGSTCLCCSHNQNLFFTLRDEMEIMFAHLEYLLTTIITFHFPPPP
nr:Gag-Pol polyprotein [Tanacetum cinerariifolium]